jgi:Tfp pilus assembly protein PilN
MKQNDLLIIEITERHLKILRARAIAGKTAQVLSFDAVKIEDASRESLAKLISSSVTPKDRKFKVVVVIPRSQVILKNFVFPSRSKEELKKMITLQITTQVPYAREDIVFDHIALGQDQNGYTKILGAVVHKEVVDEFFKIFKAAGIPVHQFILSSSSIVRWFYQQFPQTAKEEKDVCAILNLETNTSEFCFARAGQLTYSREIKYGVRDLGGDLEEQFLKDIALTLEAYGREHPGEALQKLYVLGLPLDHHSGLERVCADKKIGIQFIDFYEALKNIPIADTQGKDFVSAIVCLGAIDESQKISLNLLPEEIRRAQGVKARQWQMAKLLVLVFLNVSLFAMIFVQEFYKNKVLLDNLKIEIQDTRIRADKIKRKAEQLKVIEQYVNPAVSTVDIISALYDMTPREVSFQSLAIDKTDHLTIQGIAETRTSVNDFQRNLIKSPFLKDVNLQYAAQRRFFEGEITDFKITAVVNRIKEQP